VVKATPTPADRREFLRTCGRWTAVFVLAGGVIELARRRRIQPLSEACLAPRPCAGCAVLAGCEFPAAIAARATEAGGPT